MLTCAVLTWIALLAPTSQAATLEVTLKDKTGTLYVPREMEVSVGFKAGSVTATWDNSAASGFAVSCGAGEPPSDDIVEQLLLQVGADKWALAPGSNVRFACPAGKPVTVVDVGGQQVGSFKEPVVMTIEKAKSRAEH